MTTGFQLVRYLIGLTLACGLLVVLLIVLLHSAANFAKEGVGVLGYVASLFASGFTAGTRPPEPRGWITSLPQVGLALLFVSMMATLFFPGAKVALHVVAAMAFVALIWFLRMMLMDLQLEILCLPFVLIWFIYYAWCIFWLPLASL